MTLARFTATFLLLILAIEAAWRYHFFAAACAVAAALVLNAVWRRV